MVMDTMVAFEQWFAEHNDALAIPMTAVVRSPGSIRLRFNGIIDCIEVLVLQGEIVVIITREDICWDILAEFECKPVAAASGFACGHCDSPDPAVHPSRQALFIDHVFEPLADWIATSLMPARALGLGGSSDSGSTWAGLLPGDQTKDYGVIIPLRG